ncbi:hypothetical protein MMC16_004727 [Acarospora aff. strigata]|nr:hypothetical protein [Acarospora aff. strigata]
MATEIDWEEYNTMFIYVICILEEHSHYLHFQIALLLNAVFDKYSITGAQVEAIWATIKTINPPWLESLSRMPHSNPDIQGTIGLMERREAVDESALPSYDELLNGRGALYLILDELLGLAEDDPLAFSWRTN